jgi:hypothetical protein
MADPGALYTQTNDPAGNVVLGRGLAERQVRLHRQRLRVDQLLRDRP